MLNFAIYFERNKYSTIIYNEEKKKHFLNTIYF